MDAGCGTGRLAQLMEDLGHVRCVDASPLAIAHVRSRGLEDAVCSRLETLDLESESLDVITSIDVLYHKAVADPQAVVIKLADALRPGGVLVIHLPAIEMFRSDHDLRVHTRKRYRRGEVRELVQQAGLHVQHLSYRVMFLLPLILLWRLLQRPTGTSQIRVPAAPINRLLIWIADLENRLSMFIPLPLGLSVYAVAVKPEKQ